MPIKKGIKFKGKPLVSAVIAAHNEELHIANCINSLLAQTYKNIEVIAVENGESKDQTFNIAKSLEKEHKNVRAFSIPGKQKGPGNAWTFGIKKAKGKIILVCGSDYVYRDDYVENGIKELSKGNSIGILHKEETCNNIHNLWARAFFYKRATVDERGIGKVFTLIPRDYIIKRPYDSELGYADDQTVFRKEGTEFQGVDLVIYHTNPSSFSDTWDHSKWVGRSMNHPYSIILVLPVFPLYSLYKTIIHLKKDFYPPFIFFLPFYYSIRYFAYFIEAFNKIRRNPR